MRPHRGLGAGGVAGMDAFDDGHVLRHPVGEIRPPRGLRDGAGVAAAGAAQEAPTIAARLERQVNAAPRASVIGHGFQASLAAAARINGMAMHVLDFEPMWMPPNHSLSTVLPALLALAEWREAQGHPPQGATVARALVKGVEAQGRLRQASRQLEPAELTLHPPGVVGPIGAAVACADLLDLPLGQWTSAIGIAASRAGGLLANVGTMTKCLHCGDAAAHGLEAALLAAQGFTASSDALGGPHGFGHSYFGDAFDPAPLVRPLATSLLLEPGPAWKLFPSQYATHFAITAALAVAKRVSPAQIERVALRTPWMPDVDRPSPATGLDGKFSFQYCTAGALLDGRVDIASFSDARRADPAVDALLRRTQLTQDRAISGRFNEMHVELELQLRDGRILSERCSCPEGSWNLPTPGRQLEDKARDLLGAALGASSCDQLLALLAGPLQMLRVSDCLRLLRG